MTEEPSAVVIPTVDLNEVAKQFTENHKNVTRRVVLCAGTGCVAGGALDVHREFLVQIERAGLRSPPNSNMKSRPSQTPITSRKAVAKVFVKWVRWWESNRTASFTRK